MSGGRSSGMLLLSLLRKGLLDPRRGDVAIFNNTSAEHPATYEFVRQLARECEEIHGIPFFWIEFRTYEGASQGLWRRYATFRLVNKERYHKKKNPDGYKECGEVFEEMISFHNYLPSRQARSCTKEMKILTTEAFISEWLARKHATARLGHYQGKAQITKDEVCRQYLKRNGEEGAGEYVRRKEPLIKSDFVRLSQTFNDFSEVGVRPLEESRSLSERTEAMAPLKGDNAIDYVAIIGIRGDEPMRVARIKERGQADVSAETVYMPLADAGITKQKVQRFWAKQNYNLLLPDGVNLSNCVYCFMKGANALTEISRRMKEIDGKLPRRLQSVKGAPSDILWWDKLERKYLRSKDGFSEKTKGTKVKVGFFGVNSTVSYETIRKESHKKNGKGSPSAAMAAMEMLPCECID